jgi:hypothetical protein
MEINIEFKGIPLRVVGEYEAGEERTYYDGDLGGCPGSDSSFSVEEIFAEDSEIDLVELFSLADLGMLEAKILDKIED